MQLCYFVILLYILDKITVQGHPVGEATQDFRQVVNKFTLNALQLIEGDDCKVWLPDLN